ncbi:hypothetical protein NQ314_008680 [Rhamnusium bicolor]|uniref:RNA-binding region-containing protein 3 n=1 Tax=Rhamnusium bicolor TaxID=1586634 RepID=A0AAV8Y6Q7_9CUCU|nr:hypothetical protein NQ314_008680 [Rhamnusium bicolor]
MVKRPKFIKPPVEVQVQKKIEVKVASDTLEQTKTNPLEAEKTGSFGIMLPLVKPQPPQENSSQVPAKHPEMDKSVISAEELAANQIPHKDLGVLPVFKNYHPGAPTCRLYIKNCAKTVILKDLEYIYNRYRMPRGDMPDQFDIRLMQEGRMKGQAFVTLDSVELAQKALKETNGYILKDKPLVVVFARSAAQKEIIMSCLIKPNYHKCLSWLNLMIQKIC